MPDKDQDLLDTLSTIPDQLLHYTLRAATAFERKCDELSLELRESLSTASWLPPSARPTPPPSLQPSPNIFIPRPRGSYAGRLYDLIYQRRGLAIALVAFIGTGSLVYYQQQRAYLQKRRAKRGPDGSRKEVVVVCGSLTSTIPHSLALDLERRGFIVYITSTSHEEELVRNERKKDLMPIHINADDPFDTSNTIQRFVDILDTSPKQLHLAGVIMIPDLSYPPTPIEASTSEIWSEALNTRILHTITLTQAFIRSLIASNGRILVLTPTITSSLHLPFHGLESSTVSALESFTSSLNAELRSTGVGVCNIRLGNLHMEKKPKTELIRDTNSEVLSWPKEVKDTYGTAFMAVSHKSSSTRGSPVRELHNAVFDILTQERQPWPVVRVGRGSLVYPTFGKIAPRGFIGWLMGL